MLIYWPVLFPYDVYFEAKEQEEKRVTSRKFSFASNLRHSIYLSIYIFEPCSLCFFFSSYDNTFLNFTCTAVSPILFCSRNRKRKKLFIDIQTPWNDFRARANHFHIYLPNSHKSSQTKHNNNNGTTIIVEWCALLFNRCLSRLSTKCILSLLLLLLLLLSNSLSRSFCHRLFRLSLPSRCRHLFLFSVSFATLTRHWNEFMWTMITEAYEMLQFDFLVFLLVFFFQNLISFVFLFFSPLHFGIRGGVCIWCPIEF